MQQEALACLRDLGGGIAGAFGRGIRDLTLAVDIRLCICSLLLVLVGPVAARDAVSNGDRAACNETITRATICSTCQDQRRG